MWLALLTNPGCQFFPINPKMAASVAGAWKAFLDPIPQGQRRYPQFLFQLSGAVQHGQKAGGPRHDGLGHAAHPKRLGRDIFHHKALSFSRRIKLSTIKIGPFLESRSKMIQNPPAMLVLFALRQFFTPMLASRPFSERRIKGIKRQACRPNGLSSARKYAEWSINGLLTLL